jgi:tetratricopeptide (TPR) repeat protein
VAVVAGAVLAGFAMIAVTLYLTRSNTPAPPAIAGAGPGGPEKKGDDEADQKRREADRKNLEAERQKLAAQQRALDLARYLSQGDAALARKDYAEAEKAFGTALSLAPENTEALKGLVAAKTGAATASRIKEDDGKRKVDVTRLLEQGRKALANKEYAAAVRAFENARVLAPADTAVLDGLADAQKAADSDKAEKKKLADYKTHMDLGNAALDGKRYADAVREFIAAQQVVPGDAQAVQGQQQAEKALAGLKDREKREAAFATLFERGRKALADKRYKDGVAALEAALRILPDDRDAQRILRNAKDDLKKAQSEVAKLLGDADTALRLNRYEEAFRLYKAAKELLPEDQAAEKGMRNAQRLLDTIVAAQIAYQRFMAQAATAMTNQRYAEAVSAYAEALRLSPTDLDATNGLSLAKAALEKQVRVQNEYDRLIRLGNTALSRRAYAEAQKAFQDALKLVPDDPTATTRLTEARYGNNLQLGRQALFAGRKADAIKALEAALEDKPGDPTATTLLRQAKFLRK